MRAIVDAIKANDRSTQAKTGGFCNLRDLRQRLAQHRRLVVKVLVPAFPKKDRARQIVRTPKWSISSGYRDTLPPLGLCHHLSAKAVEF